MGAAIVAGSDAPPVLEPAEHHLDAVATPVAAPVMPDGPVAQLPPWDAGLGSPVQQGLAEPVGVISSVRDQPVGPWQSVEQGERTRVVADLARRQEEPDGPSFRIGDGVELGVEPTFRAPDEAAFLRPGPPFFDRRLDAVRCALR